MLKSVMKLSYEGQLAFLTSGVMIPDTIFIDSSLSLK